MNLKIVKQNKIYIYQEYFNYYFNDYYLHYYCYHHYCCYCVRRRDNEDNYFPDLRLFYPPFVFYFYAQNCAISTNFSRIFETACKSQVQRLVCTANEQK